MTKWFEWLKLPFKQQQYLAIHYFKDVHSCNYRVYSLMMVSEDDFQF